MNAKVRSASTCSVPIMRHDMTQPSYLPSPDLIATPSGSMRCSYTRLDIHSSIADGRSPFNNQIRTIGLHNASMIVESDTTVSISSKSTFVSYVLINSRQGVLQSNGSKTYGVNPLCMLQLLH